MVVSKRNVSVQKTRLERSSGPVATISSRPPGSSGTKISEGETQTLRTQPRRMPKWLKNVAFCVTAFISGVGTAGVVLISPLPFTLSGAANSRPETNNLLSLFQGGFQYRLSRPINILLMGVDRVAEAQDNAELRFAGRSDTMLVVHFDPKSESASVLSIPRDTQVQIPTVGLAKINQANAAGGPALARDVVSQTLNQLPIDRYVRVSTEAFRELVDELGGVDVFVPKAMKYTDVTQNLHIDLQAGQQRLSGIQAEGFARFRLDSLGDIGRVQRQQILLRAIRAKLSDPTIITKLPGVIRVLQKYIDTNLSFEEMASLVQSGLKLNQQQIRMVLLPGRFGSAEENAQSFWLMNPDARDRVLQSYFNYSAQPPSSTTEPVPSPDLQNLNIAVQNASGEMGVGSRMAAKLKAEGFNRVYVIEDWPEPLAKSEIVVQRGDIDSAISLKEQLQLGQVDTTSTGDIESDLTIRVGQDWQELPM